MSAEKSDQVFPPETVLFATEYCPEAIIEAQDYIKRQKLSPNDVKIVKRQKEGEDYVQVCVIAKIGCKLAE